MAVMRAYMQCAGKANSMESARPKATKGAANTCKLSAFQRTLYDKMVPASKKKCTDAPRRISCKKCLEQRTLLITSPSRPGAHHLEVFFRSHSDPYGAPDPVAWLGSFRSPCALLELDPSIRQAPSDGLAPMPRRACLGFRRWSAERPPTQGHPSGRARPRPGARAG